MRILILFFLFFTAERSLAGTDNGNDTVLIRQQIDRFFNAMRTSDSTLLRNIMSSNVRFATTYIDTSGIGRLIEEDVQEFIEMVGTPKNDIWDERISDLVIQIDQNLAHAWMTYSFYYNGQFSHCGVNSMELFYNGTEWIINGITDTRRKSPCNAVGAKE